MTYTYDPAGRTKTVVGSNGTTTLTYDFESRLTHVSGAPGTHNYTYNDLDTRVSKNVAGQTTSFLRDGAYVTDPVIADNLATYTPGVSERRGGTTRYTHSGLKNTGAQSTSSIVATRVYDAYGMVRSTTGTWAGPFGYRSGAKIPPRPENRGEGNESRLVGRNRDAGGYGYQEDETGLRLLGHRYYDASTGRFLTRDPIKDGRNWYSYCDGDPINGVDPTGLEWHDPVQVIVSADFKGKVIAFGDFEWMKGDGWRDAEVRPGYMTHPDMDVDMVLIIHPDGRSEFLFLMGNGSIHDGKTTRSKYYIDAEGNVKGVGIQQMLVVWAGPDLYKWWDKRWSDWIDGAMESGFPKGYEPRQSPCEPCVYSPRRKGPRR